MREEVGRVKPKLNVCQQKGKVNQLVEEEGEIVVSLQGKRRRGRVVGHWS